jgi:hypothetical protein
VECDRDAIEDRRALVRGKRVAHCPLGGIDRRARVLGGAACDPADGLAGLGRQHPVPLTGLDPLACEEEAPLFHIVRGARHVLESSLAPSVPG